MYNYDRSRTAAKRAAPDFVEGQKKKLLDAANETLSTCGDLMKSIKTLIIKAESAEQYGLPGKAVAKKLKALEKDVSDVHGALDAVVGQVEDA